LPDGFSVRDVSSDSKLSRWDSDRANNSEGKTRGDIAGYRGTIWSSSKYGAGSDPLLRRGGDENDASTSVPEEVDHFVASPFTSCLLVDLVVFSLRFF